jgi:5'(3')-deoxyribonucleotidase
MPKQKNQKAKAHSFRITFDLDDVLIDLVSHWVSALNKRHGLSVDIEDIKDWAITRCFPTLYHSRR